MRVGGQGEREGLGGEYGEEVPTGLLSKIRAEPPKERKEEQTGERKYHRKTTKL